jgi:hypothetical protein
VIEVVYNKNPMVFEGSWEREILEKAVKAYNTKTCVKFIEHTNERDYVEIVKGYGWVMALM